MSEHRYVVRGQRGSTSTPIDSPYCDLAAAARLAATLESRGSTARIFSVAEDGQETPLPTYEEAIGRLADIVEDVESALTWHRQPGGMRPNCPPELAGCPPSALRHLLRTVQR